MTKLQRELVSRVTAGVLGLALLYGGWRCLAKGWELSADARDRAAAAADRGYTRTARRSSGAGPVYVVGGLLALAGLAIGGIALVPTSKVDKVYGPRNPPNDAADTGRSGWWDLLHWW